MLREIRITYTDGKVNPRFCIDVTRTFTDPDTGEAIQSGATGNYTVREPDLDAVANVRLTADEKARVLSALAHTADMEVWAPAA